MDRPKLITFGGLSLLTPDGAGAHAVGRRRLVFLAILAAAGEQGTPRESLSAFFWPESDDDRARGALKQTVYALRRVLGSAAIRPTSNGYRLETKVLSSDLAEFRSAYRDGRMAAAAAAYGGSFLAGVHVSGAPGLERWIEETRTQLAGEYRRVLEELIEGRGGPDPTERIPWSERLVALDPGDPGAVLRLMESYAEQGRVSQAIRVARRHQSWMATELELPGDLGVLRRARELHEALAAVGKVEEAPPEGDGAARTVPASAGDALDPAAGSGAAPEVPVEASLALPRVPLPEEPPAADPSPPLTGRRRLTPRHLWTAGAAASALVGGVALSLLPWPLAIGRETALPVAPTRTVVEVAIGAVGSEPVVQEAAATFEAWLRGELGQLANVRVAWPGDGLPVAQAAGAGLPVPLAPGYDLVGTVSGVDDSLVVSVRIQSRTDDGIARSVTQPIGTRGQPLGRLDDAVRAAVGLTAYAVDPRFSDLVARGSVPGSYESYSMFRTAFESFYGDWDTRRMIDNLRQVFETDSTFYLAAIYLSYVYDALEQFEASAEVIGRLKTVEPLLPPLDRNRLRGVVQRRRGYEIDPASLEPVDRLLEHLPPGAADRFGLASRYYNAGRPGDAIRILASFDAPGGALSASDASVHWLRLSSLHTMGAHDEEVRLAENRRRAPGSPRDEVEYFDYMKALAAAGRPEDALAVLKGLPTAVTALDIFPARTVSLGGELAFHGHPEAAMAAIGIAAESCSVLGFRGPARRHPYCAIALATTGRAEEADEATATLGEAAIDRVTRLGVQGLVTAYAGRVGEAEEVLGHLRDFEDVIRQGRPDFWRARIHAKLGRREEAILALQQAKARGWFPFWGDYGYFHEYLELAPLRDDPRVRPFWIVESP